jgi:hypothetical protein
MEQEYYPLDYDIRFEGGNKPSSLALLQNKMKMTVFWDVVP